MSAVEQSQIDRGATVAGAAVADDSRQPSFSQVFDERGWEILDNIIREFDKRKERFKQLLLERVKSRNKITSERALAALQRFIEFDDILHRPHLFFIYEPDSRTTRVLADIIAHFKNRRNCAYWVNFGLRKYERHAPPKFYHCHIRRERKTGEWLVVLDNNYLTAGAAARLD